MRLCACGVYCMYVHVVVYVWCVVRVRVHAYVCVQRSCVSGEKK